MTHCTRSCFQSELGGPDPLQDALTEIAWLRSSVVSLLILAEAKPSPLTNEQVASICRVTLDKFGPSPST